MLRKAVHLKRKSNTDCILLHGYTGGPDDFNGLQKTLAKEFSCNIRIPLLIGHGTKVEDLDHVSSKDFIAQVEQEIEKSIAQNKKIIVIGACIGGLLALYLAQKYPLLCIVHLSTPYSMRNKPTHPFLYPIIKLKKYWKKNPTPLEKEMRKNTFRYEHMHAYGFYIAKQIKKKWKAKHITTPCLTIHSIRDSLSTTSGIIRLHRKLASEHKQLILFDTPIHNLFFSEHKHQVDWLIVDFIKRFYKE
ncbi:MAG: alpha/beta hydrolase [Candidatus Woesearchaeota archaeon]